MGKDITATARVRVLIEVPTCSWGRECTVEQILKQASEKAVDDVRRLVGGHARIVGEPIVIAVIGTGEP